MFSFKSTFLLSSFTFIKRFLVPLRFLYFSSFQLLSPVRLFVAPWTAANLAFRSITNSSSLLRLTSIESVVPSNHLILCHPLVLLSSIFPSIGFFPMSQFFTSGSQSMELQLQHWPSNEYSGLISFRTDWFELLPVQGTLKNPLQHHSSKASISLWSHYHIHI